MSPIDKIQKTMDVTRIWILLMQFKVNVIGTINIIRHTAKLLVENEKDESNQRGIIINTASVAAYDGQIGQVSFLSKQFFFFNFLF